MEKIFLKSLCRYDMTIVALSIRIFADIHKEDLPKYQVISTCQRTAIISNNIINTSLTQEGA